MRTSILLLLAVSLSLFSCKKDELTLTGSPSMVGAVGNSLTFSHSIPGVGSADINMIAVNDGITTMETVLEITNEDLLDMAEFLEVLYPQDIQVNGSTITSTSRARFTTDGIAFVMPDDQEIVVCKYDANVGDTWTMNANGRTVKHQVTQRSSDDDYEWGFWLLKVVTMEGTNYGLPGFEKVQFIANHKYGPVGIKGFFTDGAELDATIFSAFDNE